MKAKLKIFILRALYRRKRDDGERIPISDRALQDSCRMAYPAVITEEILDARRELEAAMLISGVRDDLTEEVTWVLTTSGEHKAKQLP